jgi:hypothetical protein
MQAEIKEESMIQAGGIVIELTAGLGGAGGGASYGALVPSRSGAGGEGLPCKKTCLGWSQSLGGKGRRVCPRDGQ